MPRRFARLAVLLAFGTFAGGCNGDACIRNSDCAAGLTCMPTGACETREIAVDAGSEDAVVDGSPDAEPDAPADAGDGMDAPDSGVMDTLDAPPSLDAATLATSPALAAIHVETSLPKAPDDR